MFMQSKSSPKNESENADGSSAEVAVCQICGKAEKQTEFSNKEKKRLDKGESATCKTCLRTKYSAKVMPVKFSPNNKRQRAKERRNLNGQYNQESSCNSHISYILFTHACSHVHAAPTLFD